MFKSNGRSLAWVMLGAFALSAYACGGDSNARTGQTFGGSGGAATGGGGASAASGTGAASGSSGSVGQGGFTFTTGGGGTGGKAGTGGTGGAAASGGASGSTAPAYPDTAAGSGAWGAWAKVDGASPCTGSGCGLGGSATDAESATCAGEAHDGTMIPLDVLIVFDNSSSMSCDVTDLPDCKGSSGAANPRIGAVRNAINNFVSSPGSADIRVGLDPFPPADPLAEQCGHDYAAPDIPIAPAKDSVATFAAVLGGLTPHLNTPTEQALTGAYAYSKAYMTANPGRSVAVMLVSDGIPFACSNDQTGAVSAGLAQAAFAGSPSIKTYVVGMGNVTVLDAIALAGSGGATHYVVADANATAQIQALLKTVTSTMTCDYKLPTTGALLDFGAVNVKTRAGDAGFIDIYKVANAAACGAKGGWFYDTDAAGTPIKITLCPQSCDPLKAASSSSMQIIIGCATMSVT
jgi:hypothetical protein